MKFKICALLIFALATPVARAESALDEDARIQARAFLTASKTDLFNSLMPDPQFADEPPPACQVSGTLETDAFYFRIESLRAQSITAQVLWGTQRSEPISLELSGEESGVKVYSWFDGWFATRRIRIFTRRLEGGWTAVRIEVKAGWWKRPYSPFNAVCYFDYGAGKKQSEPRIKSSETAVEGAEFQSSTPTLDNPP